MAVFISASKDGLTGRNQLSVDWRDSDGGGHGYRLSGPKFCGQSRTLFQHELTPRDCDEIESYIAKARAEFAAKVPA